MTRLTPEQMQAVAEYFEMILAINAVTKHPMLAKSDFLLILTAVRARTFLYREIWNSRPEKPSDPYLHTC